MTLRTLVRCAAWTLLALVALFTLAPIELRPVTGAPADIERFAAFALIGGAFCLGYPRHRFSIVVLVIAAAGLLELGQYGVAGRHGRIHDMAIKASGAVIGAITAMLVV